MKRLNQIFALCLFCTAALFLGCNNNDDDGITTCIWTTELQAEAEALSNAASAFGADPTTANCEAYRSAFQDYLNAADDLDGCVPAADRPAYQQAIDEAQAELDALQC